MPRKAQMLSELQSDASSIQHELQHLRSQVTRQGRLLRSMWCLVKEKTSLEDEDLEKMVQSVIASEGKERTEAKACPQCNRPLQDNTTICIYCGAETKHQRLF